MYKNLLTYFYISTNYLYLVLVQGNADFGHHQTIILQQLHIKICSFGNVFCTKVCQTYTDFWHIGKTVNILQEDDKSDKLS